MSARPRSDRQESPALAAAGGDTRRLLAERGRPVRVVGRAALVLALEKAVLETIRERLGVIDPHFAEEVVSEAREAFFRQLQGQGRAARSFTEADLEALVVAARQHFESSLRATEEELHGLEADLDSRRTRIESEQRQLLEELAQLSDPERLAIAGAFRERFAAAGLTSPAHDALREGLLELVAAELRAAQQRVIQLTQAQHERELERAERRIAKLAASLQATERNLRRLAESRAFDPGLASVYREVQGLTEDAAFAELKREMLAKIFEANLRLRERRQDERNQD